MNFAIIVAFVAVIVLTGCVQSPETLCIDKNTGAKLSLSEAKSLVSSGVCAQEGVPDGEYLCSGERGTWAVNLAPKAPQTGCWLSCIVDANTKEALPSWACT